MKEVYDEFHYSDKRDERKKQTSEIFTPSALVNEILDEIDYDWENLPDKTFLDPTCGSGNFLVEVAKRGVHPKNIYGVDLMPDNIEKTKQRLAEIYQKFQWDNITDYLDRNIVQGDALEYDFNFGEQTGVVGEW
jgi:2-polyprenyl-3-methyl-5-hydroxy-6-metoxy-1,4-benzoquinol methylase